MGAHLLLTAALLLLWTPVAEALVEPEICYILDAILFLYGIVLTVLYCRLKVSARIWSLGGSDRHPVTPSPTQGLSGEGQEMYETLQIKHS
uniref:Fc receptor gamma-chain n=1 Tax=Buteo japonicus TaxID=224669 RepID=A0A8C0AUG9_9AVES